MIASLTGTASLEATDGSIVGINLEEALRRARNRPIDVERDMCVGGTAFDKLDVSLALDQGRARVERGVMTSHGVTAELSGLIDLGAENTALRLNAVQTDAAGEKSQQAARLTLDISGPWSAPTIRAIDERRRDGACRRSAAVALSTIGLSQQRRNRAILLLLRAVFNAGTTLIAEAPHSFRSERLLTRIFSKIARRE